MNSTLVFPCEHDFRPSISPSTTVPPAPMEKQCHRHHTRNNSCNSSCSSTSTSGCHPQRRPHQEHTNNVGKGESLSLPLTQSSSVTIVSDLDSAIAEAGRRPSRHCNSASSSSTSSYRTIGEQHGSSVWGHLLRATSIAFEFCRTIVSQVDGIDCNSELHRTLAEMTDACTGVNDGILELKRNLHTTLSSPKTVESRRTLIRRVRDCMRMMLASLSQLASTDVSTETLRSAIVNMQLATIEAKLAYDELQRWSSADAAALLGMHNIDSQSQEPQPPRESDVHEPEENQAGSLSGLAASSADDPSRSIVTTPRIAAGAATSTNTSSSAPAPDREATSNSDRQCSNNIHPTVPRSPDSINTEANDSSNGANGRQGSAFLHSGRVALITASALLESLYTSLRRYQPLSLSSTLPVGRKLAPSDVQQIPNADASGAQHRRALSDRASEAPSADVHRRVSSPSDSESLASLNTDTDGPTAKLPHRKPTTSIRLHELAHIRNRSDTHLVLANTSVPSPVTSSSVSADKKQQHMHSKSISTSRALTLDGMGSQQQQQQQQQQSNQQVRLSTFQTRKVPLYQNPTAVDGLNNSSSRLSRPNHQQATTLSKPFQRWIQAIQTFDMACSRFSSALHVYDAALRAAKRERNHLAGESLRHYKSSSLSSPLPSLLGYSQQQPSLQARQQRLRRIRSSLTGSISSPLSGNTVAPAPAAIGTSSQRSSLPTIRRKSSLTSIITSRGTLLLNPLADPGAAAPIQLASSSSSSSSSQLLLPSSLLQLAGYTGMADTSHSTASAATATSVCSPLETVYENHRATQGGDTGGTAHDASKLVTNVASAAGYTFLGTGPRHEYSRSTSSCTTTSVATSAAPSLAATTIDNGCATKLYDIFPQQSAAAKELALASERFLKAMIELSVLSKELPQPVLLDKSVLTSFKSLTNISKQLVRDLTCTGILRRTGGASAVSATATTAGASLTSAKDKCAMRSSVPPCHD